MKSTFKSHNRVRGWHFRPVLELQEHDHVGEDEAGRGGPGGVVEVEDVHGPDGCPVVQVKLITIF